MSSQTIISLRPQNVIRQIPWRVGSRTALGFVLLFIMLSLVGWLYLTQASVVTATSYRIDELRLELDSVNNQNAALILEISQLEALQRVEKRALEMGFVPAGDVRYITVANYPQPEPQEAESIYNARPVENSVENYRHDVEAPGWLLEKLDIVAEWVAE
ncbi:MAG: hypothetical protein Kow0031_37650 [Anaerolineae bacterium]